MSSAAEILKKALEQRLREEIMSSYDSLTETRKARYSGPEEYADAVLSSETSLGEPTGGEDE